MSDIKVDLGKDLVGLCAFGKERATLSVIFGPLAASVVLRKRKPAVSINSIEIITR